MYNNFKKIIAKKQGKIALFFNTYKPKNVNWLVSGKSPNAPNDFNVSTIDFETPGFVHKSSTDIIFDECTASYNASAALSPIPSKALNGRRILRLQVRVVRKKRKWLNPM